MLHHGMPHHCLHHAILYSALKRHHGKNFTDICGNDGVGCKFDTAAVFLAALAAIPITFWFYFDQLFSCLLHQIGMGPDGKNLEKGSYYHSSFLWMGELAVVVVVVVVVVRTSVPGC